MRAKVRILEVFRVRGRLIFKVEVLAGELLSGAYLSSVSGRSLKVIGLGFLPAETWMAGVRAVVAESEAIPEVGDILEQ